MLALYDSKSEVNAIHLTFIRELGFQVNKIRFFKKTFLVVNISLDMVFGIFFLISGSADIWFASERLI